MYYLGIDVGSRTCNAVLLDDNAIIQTSHVVPTGPKNIETVKKLIKNIKETTGILESDIKATVSTGYGRKRVKKSDYAVTEISCHAKGINAVLENTDLLIDIGGQDSKAIALNKQGKVIDFSMNDRCAAGTGRFLETMARVLQVDIRTLSNMDINSKKNITLSSICTVFAESEVISMIANGIELNEIVASMNRAISFRTSSLVKRINKKPSECVISMSGGVAKNKGVVRSLNKVLNNKIKIPKNPDTIGALGAALIAIEKFK